jgi:peptidoglycan/xylan/chitin deacetylase (PgdA/CDA1 family)
MKIVCLSFDDGTIYDVKFIELLNKYHLPATLNLNSGLKDFVWYYENNFPIERLDLAKYKDIYAGHEVASHSLTHPYFSSLSKEESIKEVKEDISHLEEIFKTKIEGFAFPFHDQTEENIQNISKSIPLTYIRYSYLSNDYQPKDRFHIPIHALYDDEDIYQKLELFSNNDLEKCLFVIAGHSYEFEVKNDWDKIEKLLKYLSENKDIQVKTLKEAVRLLY